MKKIYGVNLASSSGIYCFRNAVNGKRYIGQAKNIKLRIERHLSAAFGSNPERRNKSRLYPALRKYGVDNFEISILENVELDKLTEREEWWINHYQSFKSACGYNLSKYGETNRGTKRTKAFRLAVSERQKKWLSLFGNPMTGKQHSNESKKKIQSASIKRWSDARWVKKVWIDSGKAKAFSERMKNSPSYVTECIAINIDTKEILFFKSRSEANAKIPNFKYGRISRSKWLVFRKNEFPNNIDEYVSRLKNTQKMTRLFAHRDFEILQYKEGSLIGKFPSAKEAQRQTGIQQSGISRSIRTGFKAGGYVWKKSFE